MEDIKVRPIAMTQPIVDFIPDSEGIMSYCARVSNPNNQLNFETADKLLKYCAEHGHWSVFEMVNVVLEIKAPRDISRQILRHRSGAFQEFSQRYADVTDDMFCTREFRLQDEKNRQNSISTDNTALEQEWNEDQENMVDLVKQLQSKWKERGIAKEVIRVIMPEGLTMSCMYVNFNVRSLVHYISLRKTNGTQKEHQDVAIKCLESCSELFPESWEALTS